MSRARKLSALKQRNERAGVGDWWDGGDKSRKRQSGNGAIATYPPSGGGNGAPVAPMPQKDAVVERGVTRRSTSGGGNGRGHHISTGRKLFVLELLRAGLSHSQVAKQAGVGMATVSEIKHDERLRDVVDDGVAERTRKALGKVFYDLADRAATKAGREDKLEAASAYQLAGIAGLSFDKARLHDGLSTENVSLRGVVEHHKDELGRVQQLRQALEAEVVGRVTDKSRSKR